MLGCTHRLLSMCSPFAFGIHPAIFASAGEHGYVVSSALILVVRVAEFGGKSATTSLSSHILFSNTKFCTQGLSRGGAFLRYVRSLIGTGLSQRIGPTFECSWSETRGEPPHFLFFANEADYRAFLELWLEGQRFDIQHVVLRPCLSCLRTASNGGGLSQDTAMK